MNGNSVGLRRTLEKPLRVLFEPWFKWFCTYVTHLHRAGGIVCSGKQRWGQSGQADQQCQQIAYLSWEEANNEGHGGYWLSLWWVRKEKLILKCQILKGFLLAFWSQHFGREAGYQGTPTKSKVGCSGSQDGWKSGRRQLPGKRPCSPRRTRGTFLMRSQVLLSPGFISCKAKHQKATQKETDVPKAQLGWRLGVSQHLSLEEAMVLRHISPTSRWN